MCPGSEVPPIGAHFPNTFTHSPRMCPRRNQECLPEHIPRLGTHSVFERSGSPGERLLRVWSPAFLAPSQPAISLLPEPRHRSVEPSRDRCAPLRRESPHGPCCTRVLSARDRVHRGGSA